MAAPSQGYQVKIDSLWQTYEQKKKQEEARLQRSEKILLDLVSLFPRDLQCIYSNINVFQ